jgi:hypothetical protein
MEQEFCWFERNTVRGIILDPSGSGQCSVAGPCVSVLNIGVSHMTAHIYIKISNPRK